MRIAFVSLFCYLAFSVLVSGTDYEGFDKVDVDAILSSDRLFNQYFNCILDKGSCTADGRTFKHILPEAIATVCEKCSPKQKEMAKKICNFLKNNKPEMWTEFLHKYDPKGEYVTAFEQFLKS